MKNNFNLTRTGDHRNNYEFICDVIQRGRIKPKKYKHYIRMPLYLYEDLRISNIINPENYFIEETVFFEFNQDKATINFINLYECEDMHRKIDRYLVVKFAGSYPIERGGIFF